MRWLWALAVLSAALVAVLLAGCGGGGSSASRTNLDVELRDFVVDPVISQALAGDVGFHVANRGVTPHNFVVVRSDLAAGELPVASSQTVDEGQVEVVASSHDLSPGDEETVTVSLTAGTYVLICNIPTHYRSGMYAAFTVE